MRTIFGLIIIVTSQLLPTWAVANEAIPGGRLDCKISVGDHQGGELSFIKKANEVHIVKGAGFLPEKSFSSLQPVSRNKDGVIVDGVAFETDGGPSFEISLDKVTDQSGKSFFRVWIMKEVAPDSTGKVGDHFVTTSLFAFSDAGKCETGAV